MCTATTHTEERIATETCLYVAFELGEKEWKLAMSTSLSATVKTKTLRARDTTRLRALVAAARDTDGRPWATILAGEPGFVGSPDEATLRIDANLCWPSRMRMYIFNAGMLHAPLLTSSSNSASGVPDDNDSAAARSLWARSRNPSPI